MKKIILIVSLFCSLSAIGQSYTYIAQRYDWLAGLFRALGVPAGGNASFMTGQTTQAGQIYYDSTGADSGLYVWSGLAWRKYALADDVTIPTLQEVLTAGSNITSNVNINGTISTAWKNVQLSHSLQAYNGGGIRGKFYLTGSIAALGFGGTATDTPAEGIIIDNSGAGFINLKTPNASGDLRFDDITSTVTDTVLYYDPTTKKVTYGLKPSGGGTPSLTQYRLAIGDASNLLSDAPAITGSRLLGSDANGVPVALTPTVTEANYIAGLTSNAQTQLTNKLGLTTSEIYPNGTSYNVNPDIGSSKPIELFNIGESALPGDPRMQILTGHGKNAWSLESTWNLVFNDVTPKWEQGLSTYDQYMTELGYEGITLHAVPDGTDFSDTWHEQLQIRAKGVDGTNGISSGVFIQHKTTDYWKYKSGTYGGDTDPWTGGSSTGDNPFIWMHSEAAKGTTGEFMRLETNGSNASNGQIQFKKSQGTYTAKAAAASGNNPMILASQGYDGDEYHSTARVITSLEATATNNVVPQSIWFQTSATNTSSLATRMAIFSNGNVGIGTTSPDRLLHSEISDATTNSIVYPFRISHTTSGTAAIGGGVGQEFETENASGTMRVTGSLTNPMTDATNSTEDADFAINLIRAGTLTEGLRVTSVGGLTVNGSAGTAGQVLTSGGTGAASTWTNKASLTKNASIENPTASENMFMFRTPVAITVSSVNAVLVGSASPSVTYNIAFGTDRTTGTDVYTAGQTVTSTTTGTAASGVNDATIPANSWVWITTSSQSGTVTQLNISLVYTED